MENINKLKKFCLKDLSLIFLTFFSTSILILNPHIGRLGVFTGGKYCTEILIPSLFPLMFLSRFVIFSGMFDFLKKPLNKIMRFVFYLPGCTAPAILLSLIGGYPVGASSVKTLFEKDEISNEELNRMMIFTVNAGPAFTINVVGETLLKNRSLGIMLFLVQSVVSIILGITAGIAARIKKVNLYENKKISNEKIKISEAVVLAASKTSVSIVEMCALITVFTVIISLFENLNILNFLAEKFCLNPKNFSCFAISCLEVTSATFFAAKNHAPFLIICLGVSYGGLCTHFQVASILSGTGFNYLKFQIFRVINAICCLLATIIFLKFSAQTAPVFISGHAAFIPSTSSTILGSIMLLALCIYFTAENKIFLNK